MPLSPPGRVEVELLGLPRLLARRERVSVPVHGQLPLSDLVAALAREAPALVGNVLTADGSLVAGHVFSRDGAGLLRDPSESIRPGERLLLLSTLAGG